MAGVSLATTMAIALLLVAVARVQLLDQFNSDASRKAAAAYIDIIARVPRRAARLLAATGLVVAAVAAAHSAGKPVSARSQCGPGLADSDVAGSGNQMAWLQAWARTR